MFALKCSRSSLLSAWGYLNFILPTCDVIKILKKIAQGFVIISAIHFILRV